MFNVSWINEEGQSRDYECLTEAERDAKVSELEAKGIETNVEEV